MWNVSPLAHFLLGHLAREKEDPVPRIVKFILIIITVLCSDCEQANFKNVFPSPVK
jgi:hypothetical protein